MINWREIPLVRIAIPFMIGISAAIYFPITSVYIDWFVVLLIIICLIMAIRKTPFAQRWFFGVLLNVTLLFIGYQLALHYNECSSATHFNKINGFENKKEYYIIAKVSDEPEFRSLTKSRLSVLSVATEDSTAVKCSGSLIIQTKPDAGTFHYGDIIGFKGSIEKTINNSNPQAFDYAKYLSFQNIHYQAKISNNTSISVLDNDKGNPLWAASLHWRNTFINILKQYLPTNNEYAVGTALVLGYKDAVNDEIQSAYVESGAMHLLAVSGMHIGLLYAGLFFIFKLLRLRQKHWKIAQMILVLAVVWGFAFITGATASVLRAAVMFSVFIIGQTLQRHINIYNIIAASIILLLCYNPYLLFDVGFQLSYLAIIGIIYFQPKIYKLWIIDNKLGDYCWETTSMGFAAQIMTLPIGLYYFHQFPTYFWLSGLLAIPVSTIALYLAILLFFFNKVPYLNILLGKLLFWALWLMNSIIFIILKLPKHLIDGIFISLAIVWLLYIALGGSVLAFKTRRLLWLYIPVIVMLSITIYAIYRKYEIMKHHEIIAYDIAKGSLIDFMHGTKVISLANDDLSLKTIRFAALNHRWEEGIRDTTLKRFSNFAGKSINWFAQDQFIQFSGKRMVIIQDELPAYNTNMPLDVDYVFIRDNPYVEISDIIKYFKVKKIIIDGNNFQDKVEIWKNDCKKYNILCHDINENGAWQERW